MVRDEALEILPADRLIIGDYRHVDVAEQLAGGSLDLSDPEVVLETGKTSHRSILPLQQDLPAGRTVYGRGIVALTRSAIKDLTTREDCTFRHQFDEGRRAVIKRDPTHRRRHYRGEGGFHPVTREYLAWAVVVLTIIRWNIGSRSGRNEYRKLCSRIRRGDVIEDHTALPKIEIGC